MNKQTFHKPKVDRSRLVTWLTRSGYKGWMNRLLFINYCLSLVFMLLLIRKIDKLLIYMLLLLVQSLEWYLLSQYRLMLPTGLCLFYFNGVHLVGFSNNSPVTKTVKEFLSGFNSINLIDYYLLAVLIVYVGFTFIPMKILFQSSRNKEITSFGEWNAQTWIKPYVDYQFNTMDSVKLGGTYFNYYPDKSYMWDCKLPCLSKGQQYYTTQIFGYMPGSRGAGLGSGFKLTRDTLIIKE